MTVDGNTSKSGLFCYHSWNGPVNTPRTGLVIHRAALQLQNVKVLNKEAIVSTSLRVNDQNYFPIKSGL